MQTNEIFVLGDARGGATDSRIYGLVQIDNTHGTVMTLLRRRGL
ncbi:MAG: S26 family signal peptidase [Coriobacteriia bacterium]|nr:S26 family signal peptidase [Coriobacteriia bacterium]